ncbi:Vms1/Ankzf1 family peptidyl-tRNA hydrolase [Chloroflexota bacterium]
MLKSRRLLLTRRKMLDFLDKLEAEGDNAVTLYLPSRWTAADIEDMLGKVPDKVALPQDIIELAARFETGSALFWGSSRKCLVLPPFPISEKSIATGFHLKPLYSMLNKDFTIALILVRLGAYAVGIFRGEELVTSKVGTGLVHGRHKKGGSSQRRFERHREKQIESFLSRVCIHVRERLEPDARSLNYITYGGAWTTILLLRKRCTFLCRFDDRTLPPLLDIPEPRQPVLEASIGQVWSSSVLEWYEDGD